MKRIYTFLLLSFVFCTAIMSQNFIIKGVAKSNASKEPMPGVHVAILSEKVETTTNEYGEFELKVLKKGQMVLTFFGGNAINHQLIISVEDRITDVGDVILLPNVHNSAKEDIILNISENELDDEGSSSQNVSTLLTSKGDVFTSNASYTFSPMRFRTRGLDGKYNNTYINGILVNDAERGYFTYSQIGGLNDMVRAKENINATEAASFTFGNIGGAVNINARASAIRKGFKISQVASNRTYVTRTMATYATGMMENGWAFAVSASYRWGNSGYTEGTFYDAWAFAAAAEKRINNKHSLSLTIMGAPTKRGQQAGSTQEAYDLTPKRTFFRTESSKFGNNFYNANWGYQNGVVRNAKQVKSFTPIAILSHEWKIDDLSKLTTSIGYKYQMDGRTAMNWYKSADPRPDYYRNLPNYSITMDDPAGAATKEELWRTDESYRQINWDRMYQTNYLANQTGKSGRYMIENRRNDQQVITANSVLNYVFSDSYKLDAGIELQSTLADHYKLVDDLLGADYWLDIDQYGERDNPGDANFMQNDLDNPNRKVYVGDIFGYNYKIFTNSAKLWGQFTYSYTNLDVYAGVQVMYSNFWRQGLMRNGRASDDIVMANTINGQCYSTNWIKTVNGSYGNSPVQNFITYAAKAGINYRITGRHILTFNAAYGTNPVLANNAYFSPRVKANLIPLSGLRPESYLNLDLSYYIRTPIVNGRITVYNTMFWNSSELSSFYNDEYNTFINFAMYNFNKRHTGAELGLEFKVVDGFTIDAIAAVGQNIYTSNPTATISMENGINPDVEKIINCKGFHMDGAPEIATSVGFHYFHPSYWFFDINVNYFANTYLDFNPLRRTDDAIAGLNPDNEADAALIDRITRQEKLNTSIVPITVDASIGKSIRIKYKYFININLSASNILNNTNIKTGGYEQSRFSTTNTSTSRETYLNRFPPKYFYAYGATIYLNVGFRF
ncbi:MAG: carboxypeptidase-like regulatory domain-containing protein [Bacteroidales bacterium]|nr:carboxypeptidase-like regulatory domain-containing protein [Bacteroidales bacterium]MDY5194295.1 hypothetical protein [Candidatus Aphodosoma sp.]